MHALNVEKFIQQNLKNVIVGGVILIEKRYQIMVVSIESMLDVARFLAV
jgi:hypothetical protein